MTCTTSASARCAAARRCAMLAASALACSHMVRQHAHGQFMPAQMQQTEEGSDHSRVAALEGKSCVFSTHHASMSAGESPTTFWYSHQHTAACPAPDQSNINALLPVMPLISLTSTHCCLLCL